jgi:GxxExxY protein
MAYEVRKSGLTVATQVALPILYDGQKLESGFRLDMLIEKCVIAELKAVEVMNPVYEAQIMTYLRLGNIRLGFLINFNVKHLKDGIKRFVI